MGRDFPADLELAKRLMDIADAISLKWFRKISASSVKVDGSPVTLADVEIEHALRDILAAERPSDCVYGEETSDHGSPVTLESPTWIIDPIDHTRHFARGDPNYGTLIALVVDGITRVGAISAPSLGYRWTAIQGGGAWVNGEKMAVSSTEIVANAHVALAGHREWINKYNWPATNRLVDDASYVC